MPTNTLAPPDMPWLTGGPPLRPNGLGPPLLNYAAPPDATTSQGAAVAQTAANIAQALPSWPSVEEQRQMLQPLPGWQGTAVDAAKQWAEGVMMGTTAPGDVPPPGIVAYHGSPHSFDQFDTSKIGTGEGAQAYGHGLYFAGNEGVARSYRDALSQNLNQTESAAYRDASSRKAAADAAMTELHWKMVEDSKALGAKPDNPGWGDYGVKPLPEVLTKYQDQWDALAKQSSGAHNEMQEIVTGPRPKGSMYQVNIAANPEHFLDWDKPLSEQSQHVQDALGKVPWTEPYLQSGKFAGSQIAPKTPEGAQQLKDAGVAGIRYLDQGSRAARDPIKLVQGKPYDPSDPTHIASHAMDMASGDRTAAAAIADRHAQLRAAEGDTAGADAMRQASTLLQSPRTIPPMTEGQPPGTHNYVVFDAKTIDILRKYGLAGLFAGGGAAAAATQQQQPSQ
jgi:hypothetical protein